jgi:hypothetical protein
VWVASVAVVVPCSVFVADYGSKRVQVLTPRLDFHGCVGVGQLDGPSGVCANDAVVVVSEWGPDRISVFKRGDGDQVTALFFVASDHKAVATGRLSCPLGLGFMSGCRHVAVADNGNNRVCSAWRASSWLAASSAVPPASRALPLTRSSSLTPAPSAWSCSARAASC